MMLDVLSAALVRFATMTAGMVLLWKVTLLLVLAWLLHAALARANPRWRVLLWRGVTVGLILLPPATLGLPALAIRVAAPESQATESTAASASGFSHLSAALPDRDVSILAEELRMEAPASAGAVAAPPQSFVKRPEAAPAAVARPLASHLPVVLASIWGAGVLLLGGRLALAYRRLAHLLGTSREVSPEIATEAQRILVALGCRRAVQVRYYAQCVVPFLCGLRHPVVVLPERMCQSSYRGQLPSVLVHELAHVRSGDWGWSMAVQWLSILLWFHPLAWRIVPAHRAACDAVCDAVSASYLGDVKAYCRTLAGVALEAKATGMTAALAMARVCDVRRRLAALERKVFSSSLSRRTVTIAGVAGVLALMTLAGLRLALAEPSPKTSDDRTASSLEPKAAENAAPVGLELIWSRGGSWAGVAGTTGPAALYALEGLGRFVRLNEKGEELEASEADDNARSIRTAKLARDGECALLTFRVWGPTVEARSADGKLLWSYAGGDGVDDVWAADLNGDGLDEVIVGYNGRTGLHVLDNTGRLLWKNTDIANVWHVAAGNVDGDDRLAVATTSADGKVHIFNAEGKHLRNLEPGFYGNMVRTWEQVDGNKTVRLIIVAGTSESKTTVAAMSPQGEARWSLELSARVGNAITCQQRPWLALTLMDDSVRVISLVTGKEIAHVGGHGNLADVAWLPRKEGDPILVIATGVALQGYRITGATGTEAERPEAPDKPASDAVSRTDSNSDNAGEQAPYEFSVIVAQHVMLLDGKQIVTWPQIEEMIAKRPNPSQTSPRLYITRGAMEAGRDEAAKKEIWRLHRDYKLVGHGEGSLPPRDDHRYDRMRTANDLKADQPRVTPGMTSLAEAVGVFNYLAQRDAIGKTQPLLTEDEVIAAVRWSLLEPEKLPVSDKTLAALRKVPETRELPPGFELEVLTRFQPNNQMEVTKWSVRLRIPAVQPGHTTCVSIREVPIRSRLIGEEERKVVEKWQKKWQAEGMPLSPNREYEEERAKAAEIDRSKQEPHKKSNSKPTPVASDTVASRNGGRFHLVRGNTTWIGTDGAPLQYDDYDKLCYWLWDSHTVVLPRPTEGFFDFYKQRTLRPGVGRMDVTRDKWPAGQPANITMPDAIDLPTYQLLLQPSVERALNLSTEQRTKLQDISVKYWSERRQIAGKTFDEMEAKAQRELKDENARTGGAGLVQSGTGPFGGHASPFSEEVIGELEAQWNGARKQIEDVLTSEQLQILRNLTFRTFAFGSGVMFEPKVLERLGVTKDQQGKLQALELQLQKEKDSRLRSVIAEKMKKMLAVLTPQQLSELRKKQPLEQYPDCSQYPYPGLPPSYMPDTGAAEELGLSTEQEAAVGKIVTAHRNSLIAIQREEQELAIGDEKGREAVGEKRRQEMANLRKQIEAALTPEQWARCNEIAFENLAVPYLRIAVSQACSEAGLGQGMAAAAFIAIGLGLTSEQVAVLREIDAEYFDKPEQVYRELTDKALTAFTPAQQEKLRAEVDARGW